MNKKQTIIISSLVVLILFAGFLATKVNGPLYVDNGGDKNAVSASATNYFTTARLERDNTRQITLTNLKALLNDENTPEDQKAQAADDYKNLALQSDKEMRVELGLQAQGFDEALCTIDNDKATVVVKYQGELSDQQIRQIKDVIMSKAEINNIEIKVSE
ncbi:MAG: SpoIIIAH-like family protein [Clostridium sp.]|uniref:SpoIIIAH-like family protein n=1 Tax=Clostridium culturomicium TaxID=1499683 RepID=UPI00058B0D9B|nr:SpoIIIAH-like family protein [Clostridium culturomicium]MDU4892458.1 SpoIIIAH-like family protein [Clostridium sp.]MDU7084469.1 SpoIIIAH-like family protein [Clostridium sp.]